MLPGIQIQGFEKALAIVQADLKPIILHIPHPALAAPQPLGQFPLADSLLLACRRDICPTQSLA
jgi:hypothetical protein